MADNDQAPSERNAKAVEQWVARIKDAKAFFENDFKRIRQNIQFLSGRQWRGQRSIDTERYVCNITLQVAAQKVASLYAKNPTAEAVRRPRLDYSVWDEKLETLADAVSRYEQSLMTGIPDLEAIAIVEDYKQGQAHIEQVKKICKTLELAYQYQIDSQEPDFKEELKQHVVLNAVACGVGYLRLDFVRQEGERINTDNPGDSRSERMKTARAIMDKIRNDGLEDDSPEMEQLRLLLVGMGQALPEDNSPPEHLEFSYPSPLSIIVDPRCRSLKTFSGCKWIAQEYFLPLADVNAFFGLEIKPTSEVATFTKEGQSMPRTDAVKDDSQEYVWMWEVFDKTTRSSFFVIEGYKDYVQYPAPVSPVTRRFWPIFGLTFNPVIAEDTAEVTVYPPSDVQLVKSPQKEWNRSRDALRGQRQANAPKYIARKGLLTTNDKDAIEAAEPNQVIELEGIPNDAKPGEFLAPMAHAPIDPMAYDTNPLSQDVMLAARSQEANLGPAQPNVTATVGSIAEQSRITAAASNVDDLDGFLTKVASSSGEMMLQEMSVDTIKMIVGNGALWPDDASRPMFVAEIMLTIVAASSGRPNRELEVRNYERLVPWLLQLGANPMFLVREGVKRLDDRLDLTEAFPLNLPQPGAGTPPVEGAERPVGPGSAVPPRRPVEPPRANGSEIPVPVEEGY